MIDDIKTVMWKEWKEIIMSQGGSSKATTRLRIAILIFVFGFFIPWRGGSRYIDNPMSLVVPAFVPVLIIMGIVTDSFAGERERHTLETLLASQLSDEAILIGKMVTAVLFAWVVSLAMIVLGVIGANVSAGGGHLMMFAMDRLIAAIGFNILLALVVSSAGVLVSLRASTVRQAMQTLSIGFMVIFYGGFLGIPFLIPAEWRARLLQYFAGQNLVRTELMVAVLLFILFLILFSAARLRFRRARLILD
jgi:ABC-2 type transport system permease protein